MLSCPQHHPSVYFEHLTKPNSATGVCLFPFTTTVTSSLHQHHHPHPQAPEHPITTFTNSTHNEHILRTHNSKSSSLLLHHLNQSTNHQNLRSQQQKLEPVVLSPQQKSNLLEMALVTNKRVPRFPGAVFETLSDNEEQEDDDEVIMRAVEVRRKVTAEVFKETMRRKGKFGITYSTNLVSKLDGFIDFVMIKAATMKSLPEFRYTTFNVRARTVIEDLGVVPLIRWLKHNGLSYPKIAKLICLSRGNLDSIRHLAEWLKSIHVRGEFLGAVLLKSGERIWECSAGELDETVRYLESNGVRRDWMGYVMSRCPQLLSYEMEELKIRVNFYLDMGMNEKDFGTMLFDYPRVLGYFNLQEMNQKVNYLKEFGLTTEDVGRLLAFKPQLIGCSIEERWKPLVKYLYYLGISQDGMRRILTLKPIVFCIDLEETIVPKVRFFQDIGIPDAAIGNMLVKFPPMLTYSLYKKIRPVVIFLMTKAGVSKRDIGKVIAAGPELLGCSIAKKLEMNLKYFLSLGIRHHQLGQMITDFPMLLRYNIELLRPKYRYLRRTMVRPLRDVIEFPRFFSYSLDKRICPRHKVLVENRINFKLRYMLACSDEEFETKVAIAVERRQRFESGLMDETDSCTEAEDESSEDDDEQEGLESGLMDEDPSYTGVDDESLEEMAVDHFPETQLDISDSKMNVNV